jgi:hypothetical protein
MLHFRLSRLNLLAPVESVVRGNDSCCAAVLWQRSERSYVLKKCQVVYLPKLGGISSEVDHNANSSSAFSSNTLESMVVYRNDVVCRRLC